MTECALPNNVMTCFPNPKNLPSRYVLTICKARSSIHGNSKCKQSQLCHGLCVDKPKRFEMPYHGSSATMHLVYGKYCGMHYKRGNKHQRHWRLNWRCTLYSNQCYITHMIYVVGYYIYWMESSLQLTNFQQNEVHFISILLRQFTIQQFLIFKCIKYINGYKI